MLPLLLATLFAFAPDGAKYVVLADFGPGDEFLPAAQALADFHRAEVVPFTVANLDAAFAELKKRQPDFVAFVLPPAKIDVDLVHQILERGAKLDDDPFLDFEHGFITGRDGAAALRFVERIKAAWKKERGRTAGFFATWEGPTLPTVRALTSFQALKLDGEFKLVHVKADEATRRKSAQEALASLKNKDALLFFSHGYPHEMAGCFTASDLREWRTELAPAVLVNCSCWNGAPGRWFGPGPAGPQDNGIVKPADSVCLQILDSGVPAYFAGAAPWHGPLAIQVFGHVVDDGLRLGAAAKRAYDRLALDFLPERLSFPPTLAVKERFAGEGVVNRRHNGAALIFYGDPAWAPFAQSSPKLLTIEVKAAEAAGLGATLRWKPQVVGTPDQDYLLPMNRLMDYYSVKTSAVMKELSLEAYGVAPLPKDSAVPTAWAMAAAKCGGQPVPTKTPQAVVETHSGQRFLHLRVPLDVRALGSPWTYSIATKGVEIEVEAKR